MRITKSDLVLNGRENRVPQTRDLVKVMRGVWAPPKTLSNGATLWERKARVVEARILGVAHRYSRGGACVFSGEAALVIMGADPWRANPDIMVRRARKMGRWAKLPEIKVEGGSVPEAFVTSSEARGFSRLSAFEVNGLSVAPLPVVIADLCRRVHPLIAFHNVSELLRVVCKFDRRYPEASREKEEELRRLLLEDLRGSSNEYGRKKAEGILRLADAGMESPAESAVVWALRCLVPSRVHFESQYMQVASGSRYYLDIAFPDYRVSVEPSGYGKFGETADTAFKVARSFAARQQALSDLGWQQINVFYEQIRDLDWLLSYLEEQLRMRGVPTRVPRGPLWKPPTTDIFDPTRKW